MMATMTYLLDAITRSPRHVAQLVNGETTYRVALTAEGIELAIWCRGPNGHRYAIPGGTFRNVADLRAAHPDVYALDAVWTPANV